MDNSLSVWGLEEDKETECTSKWSGLWHISHVDYRDLALSHKEGIEEVWKKRKKPTMEMDKIAATIVALSYSQQRMIQFEQQFMEQKQHVQYKPNKEWWMERKLQVTKTTLTITPFNDTEDIKNFLDAFEITMQLQEIEEDQWRLQLAPLLQGRARAVYGHLKELTTYRELKGALLKHFKVTPEAKRINFCEAKWTEDQEPEDYIKKKSKLIRWWLTPDEGLHQVIHKVLVEDLLNNLLRDMKIWIKHHQPENEEWVSERMQIYLSNKKDITTPGPSWATSTWTTFTTDLRRSSHIWNKQKNGRTYKYWNC